MSVNPNWPRWSFATMSKWFTDQLAAATPPIALYIEGDERITNLQTDYCEFRMDGPIFEEISKDWWHIEVIINVLVVQKTNDKDFHDLHRMCGVVAAACVNGIQGLKYGDGPGDDQTAWGCFVLDKRRGDNIVTTQIGQIAPDLSERQAAVEVSYTMLLDSDS